MGFGQDERSGGLVVGGDEGIDVIAQLCDGCEGSVLEAFACQDGEPDFDLAEPGLSIRFEQCPPFRVQ